MFYEQEGAEIAERRFVFEVSGERDENGLIFPFLKDKSCERVGHPPSPGKRAEGGGVRVGGGRGGWRWGWAIVRTRSDFFG